MKQNIVGMMMVRNESWCLEFTIRCAMAWVDTLVVLDDRSVDDTPDILSTMQSEFGAERLHRMVVEHHDSEALDINPAFCWNEMSNRDAMLLEAGRFRPTHVAVIDADEALTVLAIQEAYDWCDRTGGQADQSIAFPMVSFWGDMLHVRTDGHFGSAKISTLFQYSPGLAYRRAADGYDHHARSPRGVQWIEERSSVTGCAHLQFVSRERLIAKAVWYKMIELLRWPGRMSPQELDTKYDWTLRGEGQQVSVLSSHDRFPVSTSLVRYLDRSWQEAAALKLMREYPHIAKMINTHGLEAKL